MLYHSPLQLGVEFPPTVSLHTPPVKQLSLEDPLSLYPSSHEKIICSPTRPVQFPGLHEPYDGIGCSVHDFTQVGKTLVHCPSVPQVNNVAPCSVYPGKHDNSSLSPADPEQETGSH